MADDVSKLSVGSIFRSSANIMITVNKWILEFYRDCGDQWDWD